jgi:hypothetical protein
MAAVRLKIPDDASHEEIGREQLPDDLSTDAAAIRCRELGDAWLLAGQLLALEVPSVVVP